MNNDAIQVTLIKDGRFEYQQQRVVSPSLDSDAAQHEWIRVNNFIFADKIEIRRGGVLKTTGTRTTSGGYAWRAPGWGGR